MEKQTPRTRRAPPQAPQRTHRSSRPSSAKSRRSLLAGAAACRRAASRRGLTFLPACPRRFSPKTKTPARARVDFARSRRKTNLLQTYNRNLLAAGTIELRQAATRCARQVRRRRLRRRRARGSAPACRVPGRQRVAFSPANFAAASAFKPSSALLLQQLQLLQLPLRSPLAHSLRPLPPPPWRRPQARAWRRATR